MQKTELFSQSSCCGRGPLLWFYLCASVYEGGERGGNETTDRAERRGRAVCAPALKRLFVDEKSVMEAKSERKGKKGKRGSLKGHHLAGSKW